MMRVWSKCKRALFVVLVQSFDILNVFGFRRRILWLDNSRWEEIDWPSVFRTHWQMRLLYKFQSVRLEQIMSNSLFFAERDIPAITPDNYQHVAYKGLRLWELAKTGILSSLETPVMHNCGERELRVIRHYFTQTAKIISGCEWALRKYKPDTVLVTQGCTPMARPLVEIARRNGLNCVASEGSFVRDYVFCDNASGMIVNRHRAARLDGDWLQASNFTREQAQDFKRLYALAASHKRPEHQTGHDSEHADVRLQMGVPEGNRIALFIGQVLTDASVVMDSPIFPDPVSLIGKVVNYFRSKPNWSLVVRLHPKEEKGLSWANNLRNGIGCAIGEAPVLPYRNLTLRKLKASGITPEIGKIVFVSGTKWSTDHLMQASNIGITINSQAGLEMALKGKRVVVCGDAFYSRKGFTTDLGHAAGLESAINHACDIPELSGQEMLCAEQFAYHLFSQTLFRRDFQGGWRRLFHVFDGGRITPLRSIILDHLARNLEVRGHAPFGEVKRYEIAEIPQNR